MQASRLRRYRIFLIGTFVAVILVVVDPSRIVSSESHLADSEQVVMVEVESLRNIDSKELGEAVTREELGAIVAEIGVMKEEISLLSQKLLNIQSSSREDRLSNESPGLANHQANGIPRHLSVSDRFEYGLGSSSSVSRNHRSVGEAIYNSAPVGMDLYSTECRQGLCKVHHSLSSYGAYEDGSDDEFVERIGEALDGNVNIYFDNEGGQRVMYVESVEPG